MFKMSVHLSTVQIDPALNNLVFREVDNNRLLIRKSIDTFDICITVAAGDKQYFNKNLIFFHLYIIGDVKKAI